MEFPDDLEYKTMENKEKPTGFVFEKTAPPTLDELASLIIRGKLEVSEDQDSWIPSWKAELLGPTGKICRVHNLDKKQEYDAIGRGENSGEAKNNLTKLLKGTIIEFPTNEEVCPHTLQLGWPKDKADLDTHTHCKNEKDCKRVPKTVRISF